MATDNLTIELLGYKQFIKVLKDADPEVRKAMDKEIRSFLNPVSSLAKSYVPARVLSGWEPDKENKWKDKAWNASEVKAKIRVRQGGKRERGSKSSSAWRIENMNAAGAIYELAGLKSQGKTPQGQTFVRMLQDRGGSPSRLIWRAWDEKGGKTVITRGVEGIIEHYQHELQRKLNES